MHKKIICFVKYNRFFLWLYRVLGNAFICILRLFTKLDKKKILFMSFGGQKYDDSPKAIYEQLKKDQFFKDYQITWAFTDPSKYETLDCTKVKVDTFAFYKVALTSYIWIHNSSATRGLKLKRKGVLELNTWHGTPLKKMGEDISNNRSYFQKNDNTGAIYCSQSEYDQEIFTRLFHTTKENILISDLPRNDQLLQYDHNRTTSIKKSLNIPLNKKIMLYAPTFREYDRNDFNACFIKPPLDIAKWEKEFGNDSVMLFRAHYEVINILGITDNEFVINVSKYPCLNDLMAISDLLISDYSSIYFDYSITEKPMFNFSYDYEAYQNNRGLYLDLKETLPCNVNFNEDTLIQEIKTYDYDSYVCRTRIFKERFCPNAGNATQTVLKVLKKALTNM